MLPIAETLPGFSYSGWNGLSAPKGTPPTIVRKLHDAMIKAINAPETRREFEDVARGGVQATPVAMAR